MLIDSLTFALERSGALEGFWGKLDAHSDSTLGAAGSVRPFLVAARFTHKPQATLVVVAGEDAAALFARNVSAYLGSDRVLRFPAREDIPGSPKASRAAAVAQRMQAAHALLTGKHCIVVASARSLLRKIAAPSNPGCNPLVFQGGSELADQGIGGVADFEDIALALEGIGYENTSDLEGPGTYAVHGGTIDIFPAQLPYPIRLDFFGDFLEEIRRIIPATGQTIRTLKHAEIFPVREYPFTAQHMAAARNSLGKMAPSNPLARSLLERLESARDRGLWDVLLPYTGCPSATLCDCLSEDALVCVIEPRSLFDDCCHAQDDICARMEKSGFPYDEHYIRAAKLGFGDAQRASYVSLMRLGGEIDEELPVKRADVAGNGEKLYGKLIDLTTSGYTVVFSASNFRVRQDVKLAMVDHGLPIQEQLDACEGEHPDDPATTKRKLRRGVVNIVDVDIPLGMIIPKAKLALMSLADTQGNQRASRGKRIDITEITFPYKPGDYVVHAAHGVARFANLVRREVDGTERDYLLLEYAEEDKLFVPVEQLDRVTRYVGPEGSDPRLTRLNTADWSRVLTKARKATKKLAFDLVDVYSRRNSAQGFRFSPDTPWQRQMEEDFPYQETADQLLAITEIKADMQSSKPMDRLLCGDVGFGKTEVALRAAFKATQDRKQVMVLCPTTILAQQHYANFKDRCEPYGVSVEVLSRFRSTAEQKRALADFKEGKVDILIGTHRLLSRDVTPFDLGLVIIDEEQRFGVGHKEQFKNMRESIDVLTLSATPIPRTMQMAVSGVRDMSLILTPPDDRRPVEVHVGEWDPDIVSGAIRRELARNGQVYYVSNRVQRIEEAVDRVQQAAGEARIGVAHGQMSKKQLEGVMEDFSAGILDVLVATTIIESGIDNPHTNTLIIEDSQRLGLAQLYQLKGRVGRSSTQAFAYFMFPQNSALTEEAASRLLALDEHQELGSGMKIAMRDLEIRGAGSLLGAEQSGNMSAVGFDLFAQMLATAVSNAREGSDTADILPPALSDITVNIPGKAYLGEEYIPAADERILWYRRLASADSPEAVEDLSRDLQDKHPNLPPEAGNLLAKARIKALASIHGIKTISIVAGKLNIEPIEQPREGFIPMRRAGGRYFEKQRKLSLPLKYFGNPSKDELFTKVSEFLGSILPKD